MSFIPKGSPIEISHAKLTGVKADFTNKEVTLTVKVPFSPNPDIVELAADQLAFISFSDMPILIEIQQLQQVMDFKSVEMKVKKNK